MPKEGGRREGREDRTLGVVGLDGGRKGGREGGRDINWISIRTV